MDANQTRDQAELHGTFLVQRLHSNSGLNIVEQLPSDYLWELVESFEKRLMEYAQARFSWTLRLRQYCTVAVQRHMREDCVSSLVFSWSYE